MRTGLPALALIGGVASFGASGLSLALFGAGIPFVLASLLAACFAGATVYAAGRWALPQTSLPPSRETDPSFHNLTVEQRLHLLEKRTATLRHKLRGVLSPALMVSDRLLKNDDPAIRRAGDAVVRSIERATALIVRNKQEISAQKDAATPPQTDEPTR